MQHYSLSDINELFNLRLQQQIEGKLVKGYTYKLGNPNAILQAAGIPDLPIELQALRLSDKSMQENHPFDLSEIKNLPTALQDPMAIFEYGDKSKAVNLITELEYNKEKFLVGLFIQPKVLGNVLQINAIRNIFPKQTLSIVNWVNTGKGLYYNKEKVLNFLDQQRTNPADVAFGLPEKQAQQENLKPLKLFDDSNVKKFTKQRYNSADISNLFKQATKIIQDFENPIIQSNKIKTENNQVMPLTLNPRKDSEEKPCGFKR